MSAQQTSNPIPGLLRLAVVVAAGAGGWFGYDMYVEAEADTAEAAAAVVASETTLVNDLDAGESTNAVSPWPADLVLADTPWTGDIRTTTRTNGASPSQLVEFSASGLARLSAFDDGQLLMVAETDGTNVWFDRQVGAGFEPLTPAVTEQFPDFDLEMIIETVDLASNPVMNELVPPELWPHTVVNADTPSAEGTRVLDVTIDGDAFAVADPQDFATWGNPGLTRFLVEVDPAGNVVSYTLVGETLVETRFERVAEPPVFTSPVAG